MGSTVVAEYSTDSSQQITATNNFISSLKYG